MSRSYRSMAQRHPHSHAHHSPSSSCLWTRSPSIALTDSLDWAPTGACAPQFHTDSSHAKAADATTNNRERTRGASFAAAVPELAQHCLRDDVVEIIIELRVLAEQTSEHRQLHDQSDLPVPAVREQPSHPEELCGTVHKGATSSNTC